MFSQALVINELNVTLHALILLYIASVLHVLSVTLQGQGGNDCEFVASITVDGHFAMFESAIQPGSHIGALPSGQITSPTQTTKTSDASQFRVLYVVS